MPSPSTFLLGSWKVLPDLNRVEREGEIRSLEPKVMDLLVYLSLHPREVLSKERLLQAVWPDTFVGEGVLTTAISQIRKALDSDSEQPSIIETFPKRGYRLVAPVGPAPPPMSRSVRFSRVWRIIAGGALLAAILAAGRFWLREAASSDAAPGSESLSVLIANFENRTGENLLDGTLEFALEQELANSTFVKVATVERINDARLCWRSGLTIIGRFAIWHCLTAAMNPLLIGPRPATRWPRRPARLTKCGSRS